MESTAEETDRLKLAAQFVNSTSSHLFLTGKAGTGKTTFLRKMAEHTHKPFVIVAPTGIAALNAQGVTIHSQFLFPLGSFIPEYTPDGKFNQYGTRFFTQQTLASRHPLNSERKRVLRAAELLIIDEVSMLRADILDAIDYRMQRVKGVYNRAFGGVQVLFIGDLLQLPPIVKDEEWGVLRNYYPSMYFFDAQCIRNAGMQYVELNKIFRQSDTVFIDLLNNLRNNEPTQADIDLLNTHYQPEEVLQELEGVITLTTHNRQASQINEDALDQLKGKRYTYDAKVEGDFKESQYPVLETIELKEGAQIMFIRNDASPEKRYFNGKLARITSLSKDEVVVIMDGEKKPFVLKPERWENKKYVVSEETQEIEEEVVGAFIQYPIKLAWAVTVHKSQGLTFDKAIIDVGRAFAPGQVYVALSRLRSLGGLYLRSKMQPLSIHGDEKVAQFIAQQPDDEQLTEALSQQQQVYISEMLRKAFHFDPLLDMIEAFLRKNGEKTEFELEDMRKALPAVAQAIQSELKNTKRFQHQLLGLLKAGDYQALNERLEKGSAYYQDVLVNLEKQVLLHHAEVSYFSKTKTYLSFLEELDQLFFQQLQRVVKVQPLVNAVRTGETFSKADAASGKWVRKRKGWQELAKEKAKNNTALAKTKTGKRRVKGQTYEETFALLTSGATPEEVATQRNLTVSTVYGHISKGVQQGKLDIADYVDDETREVLELALKKSTKGIKEIHQAFKGKYPFHVIRCVQSSLLKS